MVHPQGCSGITMSSSSATLAYNGMEAFGWKEFTLPPNTLCLEIMVEKCTLPLLIERWESGLLPCLAGKTDQCQGWRNNGLGRRNRMVTPSPKSLSIQLMTIGFCIVIW